MSRLMQGWSSATNAAAAVPKAVYVMEAQAGLQSATVKAQADGDSRLGMACVKALLEVARAELLAVDGIARVAVFVDADGLYVRATLSVGADVRKQYPDRLADGTRVVVGSQPIIKSLAAARLPVANHPNTGTFPENGGNTVASLTGGDKVSVTNGTGTGGLVVQDFYNNTLAMLTCGHVVATTNGDVIVGRKVFDMYDLAFGRVLRGEYVERQYGTVVGQDYALVDIEPINNPNSKINNLPYWKYEFGVPAFSAPSVVKVGAATGLTSGTYVGLDDEMIYVLGSPDFAADGDSGAMVLNEDSNYVVGMLLSTEIMVDLIIGGLTLSPVFCITDWESYLAPEGSPIISYGTITEYNVGPGTVAEGAGAIRAMLVGEAIVGSTDKMFKLLITISYNDQARPGMELKTNSVQLPNWEAFYTTGVVAGLFISYVSSGIQILGTSVALGAGFDGVLANVMRIDRLENNARIVAWDGTLVMGREYIPEVLPLKIEWRGRSYSFSGFDASVSPTHDLALYRDIYIVLYIDEVYMGGKTEEGYYDNDPLFDEYGRGKWKEHCDHWNKDYAVHYTDGANRFKIINVAKPTGNNIIIPPNETLMPAQVDLSLTTAPGVVTFTPPDITFSDTAEQLFVFYDNVSMPQNVGFVPALLAHYAQFAVDHPTIPVTVTPTSDERWVQWFIDAFNLPRVQ